MSSSKFGIILKSFLPYKRKLSVLTRSNGKVMLILRPARMERTFSAGTTIKFLANMSSQFPIVKKIEVILVPVLQAETSMEWVHHLIEIVYYFAPLGAPCPELFGLVQWSLTFSRFSGVFGEYFFVMKKVCLIKLLLLLGFYPERRLVVVGSLFDRIVSLFLDSPNGEKVRSLHVLLADVSDDDCRKIDRWVWLCLQEHSHVGNFKTIKGRI